jgi:hypothetical protein
MSLIRRLDLPGGDRLTTTGLRIDCRLRAETMIS